MRGFITLRRFVVRAAGATVAAGLASSASLAETADSAKRKHPQLPLPGPGDKGTYQMVVEKFGSATDENEMTALIADIAEYVELSNQSLEEIQQTTDVNSIRKLAQLYDTRKPQRGLELDRNIARLLCAWASLHKWPSEAELTSGVKPKRPANTAATPGAHNASFRKLRAAIAAAVAYGDATEAAKGGASVAVPGTGAVAPALATNPKSAEPPTTTTPSSTGSATTEASERPIIADEAVLSTLHKMLGHTDPIVVHYAARALSNLVPEPAHAVGRLGPQLLKDMITALDRSRTNPDAAREQTGTPERTHSYLAIGLAGCCSKQEFSQAAYVTSGAAEALVSATHVTRNDTDAKVPRFVITALRELLLKYKPGSPVEQQLVQLHVPTLWLEEAEHGLNLWTRRAACKAIAQVLTGGRQEFFQADGMTLPAIQRVLQAAGKDDWMCQKWREEVEEWVDSKGEAARAERLESKREQQAYLRHVLRNGDSH